MPSTYNCTLETPRLSEALTLTVMVPEAVTPLEGEEIAHVGGVVSDGGTGLLPSFATLIRPSG